LGYLEQSRCFAVHKKLGSHIEEILKPVIELAERGVVVTHKQEERLNDYRQDLTKINGANSVLLKSLQGKRHH
jgi:gamma-glutamyltranspeptidase/glutathione hydrolase